MANPVTSISAQFPGGANNMTAPDTNTMLGASIAA
jgi:hypothetical protein